MGRKSVESRTSVLSSDSRDGGYGACFFMLDVVERISGLQSIKKE